MSSASGAARRWRPLGQWLLAAAILAFLLSRVPLDGLREALSQGNVVALALFVVVQVVVTLLADAYGTQASLHAVDIREPYGRVLWVRGATYLLGIFNYALGQGGIGFYLRRQGLAMARVMAAVAFQLLINAAALAAVCALALAVAPPPGMAARPWLLALLSAFAFYGLVIWRRPAVLGRWRASQAVLAAGLGGHLKALAGRLPHTLVLVLGHWLALRLWGVPVPFAAGLALLPVVLFVTALPITPAGLGAYQGAQVFLLSPYARGADAAEQAAVLLAFSLVFHLLSSLVQAAVGFFCWGRARHLVGNGEAA